MCDTFWFRSLLNILSFSQAKKMFNGELASLVAIENTGTIKVPHAYQVLDMPDSNGGLLIMDHIDIKSLSSQNQANLGTKLAK